MKFIYKLFFILLPLIQIQSEQNLYKIKAAFNSLEPLSIAQHLAFYQLYPQTAEGKLALSRAWKLIGLGDSKFSDISLPALDQTVHAIINLVNRQPSLKAADINLSAIEAIEKAAISLGNRKLKGHYASNEEEILALPPEEIDLAHAIFLSQHDQSLDALKSKRHYEAAIDLMALQIRAHLPPLATAQQKIRAINDFIFYELGFRFPPQSSYAKEVDKYTFLSSVIDSRRGICLGVSVLYLALAQRLELPLEIVTPPGHIYIRYRDKNNIINIETTARGINIDSSDYLSIDTYALQQRNIKETIGLVHFNRAADCLREENFEKALANYEKASLYLPNERLLDELMGACCILCGNTDKGSFYLKRAVDSPSDHLIGKNTSCEDYLEGKADANALRVLFLHVDEKRESILTKQKMLQEVVKQYPHFRAGIFSLAMTWIQLHRFGEALELLEKFHEIEPTDPKAEYYLAVLYAERFNYPKAWEHLKIAEALTSTFNHFPKALKELKNNLSEKYPD